MRLPTRLLRCEWLDAARAAAPAGDSDRLDVLLLARIVEYIGDGEGQGYEGLRYDQYARNLAAEYARLAKGDSDAG